MMFEQFTSSIARLFSENGSIAGAGFLVSSRHLLTCAHVVADALGIGRETVEKPSGKVSLDLPLVDAGRGYRAQVVVWQALRYDVGIGGHVGDVALLELDEVLPLPELAEGRQAPLRQVEQPLNQNCWAFGFPRHHDAGVWSAGILRAANASGWVQLEDKGESAYFVQPGFSGGPIWSEVEQSIVGMVAAAERLHPKAPNKRRVAFMIPVKLLKEAWPALPIQQRQPIRQQQSAKRDAIGIADNARIGEAYTGGKRQINTAGGAYFEGDVQIIKVVEPRSHPSAPSKPSPFTPPKPPKQFVARPREFEALVGLLLAEDEAKSRTVAITTAFQGGGGFGKTTLAQALCHDQRIIDAFPDGILWLTLGQSPNLVELVGALAKHLHPQAGTYSDINLAINQLRTLLTNKRVLLVLDDCWQLAHARAFLADSPPPAHLITTRRQDIASILRAQAVNVNQMSNHEATTLLMGWLSEPVADRGALADLAAYLGEWPLLLELAGAELHSLVQGEQMSLREAIAELREALDEEGFTVFDRREEQQRNSAISISLGVSLKRLGKWRQRFMELAIFPEDTAIPHQTIFKLWARTSKLKPYHAKKALRTMRALSLFTQYDAKGQTIRLHDVIRGYSRSQVSDLPALHTQFLAAFPHPWHHLPPDEPYLWHHLTYHLHAAGRTDELRSLLFDFKWLQAKLNATDINALLADYDWLANQDQDVSHLQRALRQAAHILAEEKSQLAGQLIGRLLNHASPAIQQRLTHITPSRPWLRPLTPSLQEHPALVRTLSGHTSYVSGVAVTADGRLALSGSYDQTVKVWLLENGQELYTLRGHTAQVNGVAVTPDGRLALSASSDYTVKVWRLETGQERYTLRGHTAQVNGIAVTADGRLALSASADQTVKVWQLESGQELYTLRGHTSYVNGVAVTADGCLALSASGDRTIKVWSLASGQELYTLRGHRFNVHGVAVTPDGRFALSASGDRTIKVWSLSSGQELYTVGRHQSFVYGVAVTTDGCLVLSASDDKTVKVWQFARRRLAQSSHWQELYTLRGHTEQVSGVAVTADGSLALSASWDKTVKLWYLDRQQALYTVGGHTEQVSGVAMTANGQLALSASDDKTVKVWDINSGQELYTLRGHTSSVSGVAVTADGRLALSASGDRTVKVWDINSGQELYTFGRHTSYVNAVAVTADGRLALSASWDQTVKVWAINNGQELYTLHGHTEQVNAVAVTADGRLAVSASSDKTVKVWDINSGQPLYTLRGHTSNVSGVAVTADGHLAFSASWDGTVKVWQLESGQELYTLRGHTEGVNGIAATADGRLLFSASRDKTVKVWALESQQCMTTFHLNEALETCAIAPDETTVVAGGESGRVHFLRLTGYGTVIK